MKKITAVQRAAKLIGVKDGKNTFFGPDINHPGNVGIKVSNSPHVVKALGYIEARDLGRVVKTRMGK